MAETLSTNDVLSLAGVVKLLAQRGHKVDRHAIVAAVAAGQLEGHKIGGRWFFHRDAVTRDLGGVHHTRNLPQMADDLRAQGLELHDNTLYRWAKSGRVPSYALGRRRFFSPPDVRVALGIKPADTLIPALEAAGIAELSLDALVTRLKDGRMHGRRVGGRWYATAQGLYDYLDIERTEHALCMAEAANGGAKGDPA